MKNVKFRRNNKNHQQWKIMIPAISIILAVGIVIVLLCFYQNSNAQVFDDFVKERLMISHQEQRENVKNMIEHAPDSLESVVIFYDIVEEKNNAMQHYLFTKDGDFISGEIGTLHERYNLLQWLQENGASEENINKVKNALHTMRNTQTVSLQEDQTERFMICSNLGYRDWMLISFASSDWMQVYVSAITNHTILLVAALLLFFILILLNIWLIYTHQREKIKGCQAQYSLLAQFSDTVLFEYNCQEKTLIFTPNITARFNIDTAGVLHIFDQQYRFTLVHPDDIPLLKGMLHEVDSMTEEQTKTLIIRFLNREGEYRWVRWQGKLLNDKDGMPQILIGKISDVHDQKMKELQLIQKASMDAMTGILNREATENQIMQQLKVCQEGFLFLIDVDDFKLINDRFGHAAGDRFLIHLAKQLKGTFRQNDIAGRIGGDEFVVFLPDTNDATIARLKAENLFEQITEGESTIATVSIGIAAFPADGCTYTDLYEAADLAMYKAKQQGKQGYCFMRELKD